jgi:26S proteasome regulatory subunit N6
MNPFTRELETQQYKPALALIETLLTELRRLDDKMILTEVHLLESRVYRGIGNLAKAKVRVSPYLFTYIPTSPSTSPL